MNKFDNKENDCFIFFCKNDGCYYVRDMFNCNLISKIMGVVKEVFYDENNKIVAIKYTDF